MATDIEKQKKAEEAFLANGVHHYTDPACYVPVQNAAVQKQLDKFMDYKLGFMVTWSPGCQMGTYESWALCDADSDWSQDDIDWTDDIAEFQKQYVDANKTFRPFRFRPDRWAALAKECGFRYLLFTTKHHDGFCMFDTKTTDYKITAPECPFSGDKYADITGHLFSEFQKQGLAISAYFSKPDWHSDVYWAKQFGKAPDRNVNYDVTQHPELWEQFVQYTHEQLRELTRNYGPVDALWLDGGWVRPDNLGQDIRLGEIVDEIRAETNPGLIVCDRTVGGKYENILTPEAVVPEQIIDVPWESCITLGQNFSYHYAEKFKSPRELVLLLIDIVSKGGNLALNIAPQPDGALPLEGVRSLRGLGGWLAANGEGIYGTRPCHALMPTKQTAFTQTQSAVYLFYLYHEPVNKLPRFLVLPMAKPVKSVVLLRSGEEVPFVQEGETLTLHFAALHLEHALYADCFRITF
ncbi:MAG: alpha-L-fucosidase [Ruthenibacterium sp.]